MNRRVILGLFGAMATVPASAQVLYGPAAITSGSIAPGVVVTPNGGVSMTLGAALAAAVAGCPVTGCTLTGPLHIALASPGTGSQLGAALNSTVVSSYPVSGSNPRPNYFSSTLTNSGTSTGIFENDFTQVVINGTGTISGETTVGHSYFQLDGSVSYTGTVELYETSALINGAMPGQLNNYLSTPHVGATGTVGTIVGLQSALYNDNTTAGAITNYAHVACKPMSGSGSLPTFNYCINNNDPQELLGTAGHLHFIKSTSPTVANCGSALLDGQASDMAGTVTEGTSATGCFILWTVAYKTAPRCVVSSTSGAAVPSYTTDITKLLIGTSSTAGNTYTYICVQ